MINKFLNKKNEVPGFENSKGIFVRICLNFLFANRKNGLINLN